MRHTLVPCQRARTNHAPQLRSIPHKDLVLKKNCGGKRDLTLRNIGWHSLVRIGLLHSDIETKGLTLFPHKPWLVPDRNAACFCSARIAR